MALHLDEIIENVGVVRHRIQTVSARILHLDKLCGGEQRAQRYQHNVEVFVDSGSVQVEDEYGMMHCLIANVQTVSNTAQPVNKSLSRVQVVLPRVQFRNSCQAVSMHLLDGARKWDLCLVDNLCFSDCLLETPICLMENKKSVKQYSPVFDQRHKLRIIRPTNQLTPR